MRKHTVQVGDNLKRLAAMYYGTEDKWPVIYNANRKTVQNPRVLYPGQVVNIP
jgi:nucleoid-associated protein YgaU